jgi:hypothetical protein
MDTAGRRERQRQTANQTKIDHQRLRRRRGPPGSRRICHADPVLIHQAVRAYGAVEAARRSGWTFVDDGERVDITYPTNPSALRSLAAGIANDLLLVDRCITVLPRGAR